MLQSLDNFFLTQSPCYHVFVFVTIESAHLYAFELLTATPIDLDPRTHRD